MHSPGQVSDLLAIPPSTLRRWAALFSAHLSAHANQHRRQYTDQDLATLEYIKDLSSQGILLKDIPGHLDNVVIDQTDQETTSALLSTKDAQQLRSVIAQLRSGQQATDERLSATDERLADLIDRHNKLLDLIIDKLLPPE